MKTSGAGGLQPSEAFNPSDPNARKALLKASGGIYAAVDFAGSDKSLNFATSVLAKGGKMMVTGLIGGGYATAISMFPLKAMAIEGTQTGTLKEARELIDLGARKKHRAAADRRAALGAGLEDPRRPARGQDRRAGGADGVNAA